MDEKDTLFSMQLLGIDRGKENQMAVVVMLVTVPRFDGTLYEARITLTGGDVVTINKIVRQSQRKKATLFGGQDG